MRRAVAVASLAVAVMIATTGCFENLGSLLGSGSRRVSLDDRMMEYINGRYDDGFTYDGPQPNTTNTATTRRILVVTERFPDEYITVFYNKSDDGEEVFNDNYLYFVYREQTIEFLKGLLGDILGHDFKLFYALPASVHSEKLPDGTTFEQYISSDLSMIGFTAVVAPGYELADGDSLIQRFKEALSANGIVDINGLIYFTDDPDDYAALNGVGSPLINDPTISDFRLTRRNAGLPRLNISASDIYWM
jgi:hypothetical protein